MNWILGAGTLLGVVISIIGFVFNSSTPMQVGPIPVIGGGVVALICLVALIARVVTGK